MLLEAGWGDNGEDEVGDAGAHVELGTGLIVGFAESG